MTDQILTTFETTLTWYCVSDLLPNQNREVLIFDKYDEINQVKLKKMPNPDSGYFYFEKEMDCNRSKEIFSIENVKWWAYCPTFD